MKKLLIALSLSLSINAEGLFKGDGLGVPNPLHFSANNIKSNFTDKSFGIEINPLNLLLMHRKEKSITGTFSYFDHQNAVEYAMPLNYYSYRGNEFSQNYKQFTIDLHYRKFVEKRVGGAYFSGFIRYANLDGAAYKDGKLKMAKQSKVGLGGGVGYRYFANNGFYWGVSLSLGSYIGSNRDLEYDSPDFYISDDQTLIVDIELLKFGWAF